MESSFLLAPIPQTQAFAVASTSNSPAAARQNPQAKGEETGGSDPPLRLRTTVTALRFRMRRQTHAEVATSHTALVLRCELEQLDCS